MAITKDFITRYGIVLEGTAAVSSSTGQAGAFQSNGGAAIAKNLIVGTTATIWGSTTVYGGSTLQSVNATSITATGIVTITSSVATTSTTTGALVVTGGVGVGGSVYAGNFVAANAFTGTSVNLTISPLIPAAGVAGGTLRIQGAPFSAGSGLTAGRITIQGGQSNTSTLGGGRVDLLGGNYGGANTTRAGGPVYVTGGCSNGSGGIVYITGGAGYGTSGGDVNITGGGSVCAATGSGGSVTILSGFDSATGSGSGSVTIGTVAGTTSSGNLVLQAAGTALVTLSGRTGITTFNSSLSSTSTTSGALTVVGGVGIGGDLYVGGNTVLTGDVAVNGGDITTTAATFNLVNTNATTVNFAGAGTAITIGATSGLTTIRNSTTISNGLYVGGIVTATSFVGNLIGGATTATTSTNLAGGATGSIPYQTSTGVTAMLAIGANATVLTSNGTTPAWSTLGSLSIGTANTASNIAAGTAGQIPYQIAPGSTGFAGPGTAGQVLVSGGTGSPVYQSTLTLAGNTAATSTTTGALQVVGGVGIGQSLYVGGNETITGQLTVNSTQANTGTAASNAVYVAGGVYIDKSLVVVQDTLFKGPVTFSGSATYVLSTNTYYTDNLLEIHTPPSGVYGLWNTDDGKDIGFRFHYYTAGTDTNAALVLDNTTKYLDWYSSGAESAAGDFSTATYGTFRTGKIILANGTPNAASTNSGDLQVQGGVGIGGSMYVAGVVTATTFIGNLTGTATTATNIAAGTAGQLPYQTGPGATGFVGPGTAGQILVSGGTGTPVYQNTLTLAGSTAATSTTTGALQVVGGAGIGQSLYVGGDIVLTGDIAVNGGDITTTASTFNLINTNATTVNFAGAGTTITIGASNSGYTNIRNATTVTSTTAATSTTTGALVVTGGAGIGQSLYVGGSVTVGATAASSVVTAIASNNYVQASYSSAAITNTVQTVLDTFSTSTYRTAKYLVQIVDGSSVHSEEIMLFHDNTNVYLTEYASIFNNWELGTFDADINANNVRLKFTAITTVTSMVVKVMRTGITS